MSRPNVLFRSWDEAQVGELAFGRGVSKHLAGSDDGLATTEVHINEIWPQSGLGQYHVHKRADSVYLVLSGTMVAVVDGLRYQAPESSAVIIHAGTPHAVGNGGGKTLRVVEIYAPAGSDFHAIEPPAVVIDAATRSVVDCHFADEPLNR
jgi:mannose-6-phosphate isomerase-like protein (cupin superfamily)